MTEYARELAHASLSIGAIKLEPETGFVWASGFTMPIYNDNRMLLADAGHRKLVAQGFADLIEREQIPYEFIAGTATAGIPPATTLADLFGCQLIYVRSSAKGHGLMNRIEGIDAESDLGNRPGIAIEDLISTGGSSARTVQAVRDAKGVVDYCLSIFSYGLGKADEAFACLDPSCKTSSILTYDVMLEVAVDGNFLRPDQVEMLKEWRTDPFGWGKKHGFPSPGGK